MTLTLGIFIRQALRLVEHPRLSFTAYGDEGAILRTLSNMIGPLAVAHGWVGDVAETYKDDDQPYLAVPLDLVPELVLKNLVSFLEGLLTAYEPMRVTQTDADRRALLLLIQDRLSCEGGAQGSYPLELMGKVVSAVTRRDLFDVVRGDADWALLQRCDLLAVVGPYLIEEEPGFTCADSALSLHA